MDFIKGWMLAIIGITALTTFVEIIMPDAELKKYAKLIIGIVMMIILIRPIANIGAIDILTKEYNLAEQSAIMSQSKGLEAVQWSQIEQEFSNRFQKLIMDKLGKGYEHIQVKATLSQDGIDRVTIENANEKEKDAITKLLVQEFKISADGIVFIGG